MVLWKKEGCIPEDWKSSVVWSECVLVYGSVPGGWCRNREGLWGMEWKYEVQKTNAHFAQLRSGFTFSDPLTMIPPVSPSQSLADITSHWEEQVILQCCTLKESTTRIAAALGSTDCVSTFALGFWLDLDLWPLIQGELWSRPIDIRMVKVKGHFVQTLAWKEKDGCTDGRRRLHYLTQQYFVDLALWTEVGYTSGFERERGKEFSDLC